MLALREDLALADHRIGPAPVRGVDHTLAEQMLDAVEPGQLVQRARIDQLDAPVLGAVQAAQLLRHADARRLALDQELVHPHPPAGFRHLLDQVGQLDALLPRRHEDDARRTLDVGACDF